MLLGQQDGMYIGAVVVAGGGATRYGGKAGNGESIVGTVLSGNFVTFE